MERFHLSRLATLLALFWAQWNENLEFLLLSGQNGAKVESKCAGLVGAVSEKEHITQHFAVLLRCVSLACLSSNHLLQQTKKAPNLPGLSGVSLPEFHAKGRRLTHTPCAHAWHAVDVLASPKRREPGGGGTQSLRQVSWAPLICCRNPSDNIQSPFPQDRLSKRVATESGAVCFEVKQTLFKLSQKVWSWVPQPPLILSCRLKNIPFHAERLVMRPPRSGSSGFQVWVRSSQIRLFTFRNAVVWYPVREERCNLQDVLCRRWDDVLPPSVSHILEISTANQTKYGDFGFSSCYYFSGFISPNCLSDVISLSRWTKKYNVILICRQSRFSSPFHLLMTPELAENF